MKTTSKMLSVALAAFMTGSAFAQQAAPKVPYEILYIGERYAYPGQITRPAGSFLLVIKNHSAVKNLRIHVKERGGPNDVIQANLDDVNGNYSALLNLQPGTYDLSEPGYPTLKCTLTITR